MKRIGIIGGMSYGATALYFTELNRIVNQEAGGGLNSAEIFLCSINSADYYELMRQGEWDRIGARLAYETKILRYDCKCNYIALSSGVMHKSVNMIERLVPTPLNVQSPVIHIGDCIAEDCLARGFRRVAILGTRPIMTENFLAIRLNRYGIFVDNANSSFLSDNQVIDELERIIFEELCCGTLTEENRRFLENLVDILIYQEHFDGVVLACTELGNVFRHTHIYARYVVDSSEVHIRELAKLALS